MREMTEQQYDALRENRRSVRLVALNELTPRARRRQQRTGKCVPTPLAAAVAEAAESLRRRQLAAAAWAQVVPPAWAGETAVTDVHRLHKDTVTIAVSGSALLCELRRRQPALEQGLARLAPGIRHIRFVVGDPPP